MKLIMTSDTHGSHEYFFMGKKHVIEVSSGDVFIHAGDCMAHGSKNEFEHFVAWMRRLPHKHKIFVPGNHDGFVEAHTDHCRELTDHAGIDMLIDQRLEIDGVKFWGSPWTPVFRNWYFMKERGEEIRKHWDLIPDDTDVLITHGPPQGVLDRTSYENFYVGCEDLKIAIDRVKPKLNVFGHVHEGRGSYERDGVAYFNVSCLDSTYSMVRAPAGFEI